MDFLNQPILLKLSRNSPLSDPCWKKITLKAACRPGGNLEAVITVMFPDED